MKILAIRGKNLASLVGTFEVDFEQPPFNGSGLYAITGPTGAGKTTLLDALCLALFNETPRLATKGGDARFGRATETSELENSYDPRTLLSRGQADAFAEVDFKGSQQQRLRATWRVRRARNSPHGKLQKVEMKLVDLESSNALASGIKPTRDAVIGCIGLDFDQFCRSVLLAQGQFAAFLKADADVRASLLEQITGDQIYSDLSRAAFVKYKDLSEQLKALKIRHETIEIIADEELQALTARIAQNKSSIKQLKLEREKISKGKSWFQKLEELLALQEAREKRVEETTKLFEHADEKRKELILVEKVQSARTPLNEYDSINKKHGKATKALHEIKNLLGEAQAESHVATANETSAKQSYENSKASEIALGPELKKARELDTQIKAFKRALKEHLDSLNEQKLEWENSQNKVGATTSERKSTQAKSAKAQQWQTEHVADQILAKSWPQRKAEIEQFSGYANAIENLLPQAASAIINVKNAQDKQQHATVALEQIAIERDQNRTKLKTMQTDLKQLDRSELSSQREELETQRERWSTLTGIHEKVLSASHGLKEQDQIIETESLALAPNERALKEAQEQQIQLDIQLKEARMASEAAQSVAKMEDHRSALIDEAPCPLCGSIEHPWAHSNAPDSNILVALKDREKELEKKQHAFREERSALATKIVVIKEKCTQAKKTSRSHSNSLKKRIEEWESQAQEMAADEVTKDPLAMKPNQLKEQLKKIKANIRSVGTKEKKAQTLAQQVDNLQKEADQMQARIDALTRQQHTAQQECVRETSNQSVIKKEYDHIKELANQVCVKLESAFMERPDWRVDLEESPVNFLKSCVDKVATWETKSAVIADAKTRILELQTRLKVEQKNETAAQQKYSIQNEQHKSKQSELARHEVARKELLKGREANQVEVEIHEATKRLAHLHEEARQKADANKAQVTEAIARHDFACKSCAESEEERQLKDKALQAKREEFNLTVEQIRALLSHDFDWIKARRQDLKSIEKEHFDSRSRFQETIEQRKAHEAQSWECPLEELSRQDRENNTAFENAEAFNIKETGKLESDRLNRIRREKSEREIEKEQEKNKQWQILAELIGSHDGKKFRTFAQSLTLELLLSHANEHLKELAPRYRLERVPAQDMSIQVVDRDMGDEIRSVESLSGGEGFLASLALAWALASLTSERVQLDSLFIDEGFGTLDMDALEVALSALDALQASGRQIGLISHVPWLEDRVGTMIRIERVGPGTSKITIPSLKN